MVFHFTGTNTNEHISEALRSRADSHDSVFRPIEKQ